MWINGSAQKVLSICYLWNNMMLNDQESRQEKQMMRLDTRVCVCAQSCPTLCDPWTVSHPWVVAHQAPLSMGFSRQEHWSRLLFPSPGEIKSISQLMWDWNKLKRVILFPLLKKITELAVSCSSPPSILMLRSPVTPPSLVVGGWLGMA